MADEVQAQSVNDVLKDDENVVKKCDRSASKVTNDSGFSDEETSVISSEDENGENYHFVEAVKVLGVHKQEKPKVQYLFVIIVRWNDKSQVTVYRRWTQIKEFQDDILRATKDHKKESEAHHFIKKTAHRVKRAARFRHGTIKKLDMIDSLNHFFEAVLHYDDTAHCDSVRRFFKPTDNDLNSISWSGDGRTYFYVTRDVLGERNTAFDKGTDLDDDIGPCNEEDVVIIDASRHINAEGTAIKHTEEEFNDALNKYSEADPNISWPIESSIHVALCDYDASGEDAKDRIIGLTKDEEVDVLDQNESGWWLVSRTLEDPKTKNGLNECGYVPAGYLRPKERKLIPMNGFGSLGSTSSSASGDYDTESSFETSGDEVKISGMGQRVSAASFNFDSSDENENEEPVIRKVFQRSDLMSRCDSSSTLNGSDLSGSPWTSMESVVLTDAPTPKPRRKALGCIGKMNSTPISPLAQNQKCMTPVLGQRKRFHSEREPTSHLRGSMTPPIIRRSKTLDPGIGDIRGSTSDLTKSFRSDMSRLPSFHGSTSSLSVTKKGIDFIAIKEYHATKDDELSFQNGAIVKIISRNATGWWMACYQGKTGLVPAVNLKRYRDPLHSMSLLMLNSI